MAVGVNLHVADAERAMMDMEGEGGMAVAVDMVEAAMMVDTVVDMVERVMKRKNMAKVKSMDMAKKTKGIRIRMNGRILRMKTGTPSFCIINDAVTPFLLL